MITAESVGERERAKEEKEKAISIYTANLLQRRWGLSDNCMSRI